MKAFRGICLLLALALVACLAPGAALAQGYYDYSDLLGSMEVVNCASWTSLREYPDSSALRLAQVPLGAIVTDCYYINDKWTYCVYDGIEGYVLSNNLSFIYGPYGYEYAEADYLGNFQIVNCTSYASLRAYPDTKSELIVRVPLGEIVTNVFYEDDRFCYCMWGEYEGYILSSNLSWISGGPAAYEAAVPESDWLGDCVIINCLAYASLREYPDTSAYRLARVPLGAVVTDCYFVSDDWVCCTWDGIVGYILTKNLGQ